MYRKQQFTFYVNRLKPQLTFPYEQKIKGISSCVLGWKENKKYRQIIQLQLLAVQ